jgi:hypothetical protein
MIEGRIRRLTLRPVQLFVLLLLTAIAVALAATGLLPGRPVITGNAAGPTAVCGTLATTTWNFAGSPYQICASGATIPNGATITIDGTGGKVTVSALGTGGLSVSGALATTATSATNTVTFDGPTATPGSWAGLNFATGGTGSLDYASILHASYPIQISSGGTSLTGGYGLLFSHGLIDQASADAIYATSTPISVTNSTITNIGSHGIYFSTSSAAHKLTVDTVRFDKMPYQAVYAGVSAGTPVSITNNTITAAGTTGPTGSAYPAIDLNSAETLTVSGNVVSSSSIGATKNPAIRITYGKANLGTTGLASTDPRVDANTGHGNGIDALLLAGVTVLNSFDWITPRSNNSLDTDKLGYVATGTLALSPDKTLTVGANDVVKLYQASLQLNGGHLRATAGGAVFTSTRDTSFDGSAGRNVAVTCPTSISSDCNVAGGDWSWIYVNSVIVATTKRSDAAISNASIKYAGYGIYADSQSTALTGGFGVTLSGVTIDQSSNYGVYASSTPVSMTGGAITNGLQGIYVTDSTSGHSLSVSNVTFDKLKAQAIYAGVSAGVVVSLTNNAITASGTTGPLGYGLPGIDVSSSDNLNVVGNKVSTSATGSTKSPAIRLAYSKFNLGSSGLATTDPRVDGNTGYGNGVDAIQFSGGATVFNSFAWVTPRSNNTLDTDQLGYVSTGTLVVSANKTLTVGANDVVKMSGGYLQLTGAHLVATAGGAVFTSTKDTAFDGPTGRNVAVTCPTSIAADCNVTAGDWTGIYVTTGTAGVTYKGDANISGGVAGGAIKYGSYGLFIDSQSSALLGGFGAEIQNMTIDRTTSDAVYATTTPITVSGGAITNSGAHGLYISDSTNGDKIIVDSVRFDHIANQAFYGAVATGVSVRVTNNTITTAGTSGPSSTAYAGIEVTSADTLTVSGNVVSTSGIGSTKNPAIKISYGKFNLGSTGLATTDPRVDANTGHGNGIDAVQLNSSTVFNSFNWITPRSNNTLDTDRLGYVATSTLNLSPDQTLTVGSNDVAKLYQGYLQLNGAHLNATAGGAAFTSTRDTSYDGSTGRNVAVTCPSSISTDCNVGPGDWSGIWVTSVVSGTTKRGDASITAASIKYAGYGVFIDSQSGALAGGNGLMLTNVTIDQVNNDAIYAQTTPISVTGGTITHAATRGVYFSDSTSGHKLTVSGVTFDSIASQAIYAGVSNGVVVSLSGNTINRASTSGSNSALEVTTNDNVTVANNKVTNSGNGAGASRYPAIKLTSPTTNLGFVAGQPSVYGNTGKGNGLDAIQFDGAAVILNDFNWQTPRANAADTDALGYIPTGSLAVSPDRTLTLAASDVFKSSGNLYINGGHLVANAGGIVFTSLKDTTYDTAKNVLVTCPSSVATTCTPTGSDWSGVSVQSGTNSGGITKQGDAWFAGAIFRDASTAITHSSTSTALTGNVGLAVSGSTFDSNSGYAIYLGNSTARATITTSVFTNNGGTSSYAVYSYGGATVDCSTVHSNGSGFYSGGTANSIAGSDLFGNSGTNRYDLYASSTTPAQGNWWGQSTGPAAGQVGGAGADASSYLTSQAPTVNIGLTSNNTVAGKFGPGTMTVTLTFSRLMDTTLQPTVSFDPGAHAVSGNWQMDRKTWVGTYVINATSASGGTNTLNVSGARSCVPDPSTNLMTPASTTFVVDLGTVFYFAEGYTGFGFTEKLYLFTPNDGGTANIDYYTPAGHTVKTATLVKGVVTTVDVNAAVGADKQVSIKVTLPVPGVVEREINFDNGNWRGSTNIVGVIEPNKEWNFAEGSTLHYFSEYLTLQNTNSTAVTVDINYFTDQGAHPTRQLTLPPSSRTTVEVFNGSLLTLLGDCTPNGPGANCGVGSGVGGVSTQVKSRSLPIIAERPFYVNSFSFGLAGDIKDGHDSFGATIPGKLWYFAEGTTLDGFKEYLTLQNGTNSPTTVDLNYVTNVATVHPVKTLVVPANSRVTVEVFSGNTSDTPSCTTGGGGTCGVGSGIGGVSVKVVSRDQPIVAERPMYMVLDFGTGPVAGAHDVLGAVGVSQLFGFAHATTNTGEKQYLTVQNPGTADATVTAQYYTGGTTPVTKTFAVTAGSRVTLELFKGDTTSGSCSPTGAGCGLGTGVNLFGIVLQSDKPILVEKPTYSSNAGTYGATDTLAYLSPGF